VSEFTTISAPADQASRSADAKLRELLDREQYGEACAHLHAQLGRQLGRFVGSRRPPVPIEDMCQEIWAAVLKALPRFRFQSTARTWLFAIAERRIVDARRADRSAREEPWDDGDKLISRALGIKRPTTPSTHLRRKARAAALEAALALLTPSDRELVELRWICDLYPAQIVEVLELRLDPNTVSQKIHRATERLREALRKHDFVGNARRRRA
jgi:RNA polymerase sigma factor (sigma-70 family)